VLSCKEFEVEPMVLSPLHVPERVLQRHLVSRGTCTLLRGLIKWSLVPESLGTWEDLEALQQKFPWVTAWGQAGSLGWGVWGLGGVLGSLSIRRAKKLI
jgi:hypothetical protein